MTPGPDPDPRGAPQTRRERQREATYDEIVRASRELLAEGAELSLRAVAGRMGMTAPALYRYVASYQELVDLVAFEIDKAATETFAAAADALPEDDYAGRLVASATEFRMWALANPREFGLAFANPIADAQCVRREMLTHVALRPPDAPARCARCGSTTTTRSPRSTTCRRRSARRSSTR